MVHTLGVSVDSVVTGLPDPMTAKLRAMSMRRDGHRNSCNAFSPSQLGLRATPAVRRFRPRREVAPGSEHTRRNVMNHLLTEDAL